MARRDALIQRFVEAVEQMPWVAERLENQDQFNCYESASNDEDDDPEDWEYYIALGPISDWGYLGELRGEPVAKLIEAALKLGAHVAADAMIAEREKRDA